MQKCKKCNNKLGYKIKMRSLLFGYSPIVCEGCGGKYYVRFYTRIILGFLIGLPVVVLNNFSDVFGFVDRGYGLLGYLIWIVLVMVSMPCWAGYYLKD